MRKVHYNIDIAASAYAEGAMLLLHYSFRIYGRRIARLAVRLPRFRKYRFTLFMDNSDIIKSRFASFHNNHEVMEHRFSLVRNNYDVKVPRFTSFPNNHDVRITRFTLSHNNSDVRIYRFTLYNNNSDIVIEGNQKFYKLQDLRI